MRRDQDEGCGQRVARGARGTGATGGDRTPTISNRARHLRAVGPTGASLALACILHTSASHADPLRLRADAYAQTPQPAGLLVLQGEDRAKPWLSAEALAWLGTGADHTGDVLTLVVRARDVEGRGEARAGRFLVATGAVRPLHIDGASVLARTPWGTSLEAFGGVPVVPRFGERDYDWAVGGRLAQRVADRATLGFAYLQRRDHGRLSDEEVGGDLARHPAPQHRHRDARRLRPRVARPDRRARLGGLSHDRPSRRAVRYAALALAPPARDLALLGPRRHPVDARRNHGPLARGASSRSARHRGGADHRRSRRRRRHAARDAAHERGRHRERRARAPAPGRAGRAMERHPRDRDGAARPPPRRGGRARGGACRRSRRPRRRVALGARRAHLACDVELELRRGRRRSVDRDGSSRSSPRCMRASYAWDGPR